MALRFDLSLEDRRQDRVFVSVLLAPEQDGATVDGVAVMLVTKGGDPLSHRLLLPIAGRLIQPMVSTVELRASGDDLPSGARVVGMAWNTVEQWDASCPADPGTQLEQHMRGRNALRPDVDAGFQALACDERLALARVFPWLAPCELAPPKVVEPEMETASAEELKQFCDSLDLDDEDSEWLEALLRED